MLSRSGPVVKRSVCKSKTFKRSDLRVKRLVTSTPSRRWYPLVRELWKFTETGGRLLPAGT